MSLYLSKPSVFATHYGTGRFRHYCWKYSLHCLAFHVEFKVSSAALELRLAVLLSHLFAIPIVPVAVAIILHQYQLI